MRQPNNGQKDTGMNDKEVSIWQLYANRKVPLISTVVEFNEVMSKEIDQIVEQIIAEFWKLAPRSK